MLCPEINRELGDRETAVIEGIAATAFNVDEKLAAFIKLKNIAADKKNILQ